MMDSRDRFDDDSVLIGKMAFEQRGTNHPPHGSLNVHHDPVTVIVSETMAGV